MLRSCAMILVVVFLALQPSVVYAQTITFDDKMPSSPAGGKINATGAYTMGNYLQLNAIFLYAFNVNGGQGGDVNCMVDKTNKSWSGTIDGLPKGTYRVFASATFVTGGNKQWSTKPVADLDVAAGCTCPVCGVPLHDREPSVKTSLDPLLTSLSNVNCTQTGLEWRSKGIKKCCAVGVPPQREILPLRPLETATALRRQTLPT